MIEKETIKELGKYFLDISKILLALTLIAPFMKDGMVSITAIVLMLLLFGIGINLTNRGVQHER